MFHFLYMYNNMFVLETEMLSLFGGPLKSFVHSPILMFYKHDLIL